VNDVAQRDTNEINLEEQLHPTKCDKKDGPWTIREGSTALGGPDDKIT